MMMVVTVFADVLDFMEGKDFLRNNYWNNKSYIGDMLTGNKRTFGEDGVPSSKRVSNEVNVELDIEILEEISFDLELFSMFLKSSLPKHMYPMKINVGNVKISHRVKRL